jgi:hypothetical protein
MGALTITLTITPSYVRHSTTSKVLPTVTTAAIFRHAVLLSLSLLPVAAAIIIAFLLLTETNAIVELLLSL